MPELPEVETMRRNLRPALGGTIEAVEFPRRRLRPIGFEPARAVVQKRLVGRTIAGLGRVGKRVVVELDDDSRLVFEPRMTGLVLVAEPPNRSHLRLALWLSGAAAGVLWFWDRRGLGWVRLLSADAFAARYAAGALGPDALAISASTLRRQLARSRRAVKVALLDQKAVAGIGNLYASEILHRAAIHPGRPCDELSPRQWSRLAAATRHILAEAIRYEGSTLSDGTYLKSLDESGGYQLHHRVYDKEGQICPRCRRATVVRIVQAQRSTFYCPACQGVEIG